MACSKGCYLSKRRFGNGPNAMCKGSKDRFAKMRSDALPPDAEASTAPILVVTVDTEEEGLWSGTSAETGAVTNIRGIPRFQQLCDQFRIRPTYLVDAPVVQSQESVSILRPLQDQ